MRGANRRERITCGCGGDLSRPLPKVCPHCGAEIEGVRYRLWPRIYPLLIIALMFVGLVAYVVWLAGVTGS